MRRPAALSSVAALLMLGACADAPLPLAPASPAGAPRFAVVASDRGREVSTTVFDCNFNRLDVVGQVHYTTRTVETPGGRTLTTQHLNFAGTATDAAGTQYTANGVYNYSQTTGDAGELRTRTIVDRVNLITPGGAPNQRTDLLIHLTFDANGELTAITFESRGVCPSRAG